jgi:hypothetical protein
MRFRLFEYIFLSGAIGTLALFPLIKPFLPILMVPTAMLFVALTASGTLGAIALFGRHANHPRRATAGVAALLAGCGAFFASASAHFMPSIFVAWAILASAAILSFGAILARRFFRHVEKDFRRNAAHAIIVGLMGAGATLAVTSFAGSVPPFWAGAIALSLSIAALL